MSFYAVFGDPIAHSLSPKIHLSFAKEFNIPMQYQRTLSNETEFIADFSFFRQSGGVGANVTSPLKSLAYSMADVLLENAQIAGSVNTLYWKDKTLIGANTDGQGLINDLISKGIPIKHKNILIIGAGSSASLILYYLSNFSPASITVVNRDKSKLDQLKAKYDIDIIDYDLLNSRNENMKCFDFILNISSAGLSGKSPNISSEVLANSICYDLNYGKNSEPFLTKAEEADAKQVHCGLGMLVEQAALSFKLMHGVMPSTKEIKEDLLHESSFV